MVKFISFAWNFLQTGTENTNKNQKGGFLNETITVVFSMLFQNTEFK